MPTQILSSTSKTRAVRKIGVRLRGTKTISRSHDSCFVSDFKSMRVVLHMKTNIADIPIARPVNARAMF
jgi:hypothetical protein